MWKLYYQNRTAFSPEDGDWTDAPPWGVMAVATSDPVVGREIGRNDFYIWLPWADQPAAADHWGVVDLLLHTGTLSASQCLTDLPASALVQHGVKFGRSVQTTEWREIWEWVVVDADRVFGGDHAPSMG